ncbi:alpha/beta fold hydrolase [Bacillus sp. CGMCC 1.60114]|uniref:alpha/beta hydrolase n=1 Tax=unclassified Bacillus (in: firmicutes) TaxID=185979 RepID=UPI00363A23C3
MRLKNQVGKKLLLVWLICILSIPASAFGKEANSQSDDLVCQQLDEIKKTDAVRTLHSPDLLINRCGTSLDRKLAAATEMTNSSNQGIKDPLTEIAKRKNRSVLTAFKFVQDMQMGNYQSALQSTSSALQKGISEQWIEAYWNTLPLQLNAGSFIGFGAVELKKSNPVHTNVEIGLIFEKATVPIMVRLDPSGKVDDFLVNIQLSLTVAGEPSYSHPNSFTEKEIVIGEGPFALPGTLSVPKGKGPFPTVVLVQGSGASDKDETAYALKPFRDLAQGLASKGIAVLRYNKRTFEHSVKTMTDLNHTVDKETTDDALLAVRFLQSEKKIDNSRIYILGHSQGGMMVPQMLNKDERQNIAGAIVMGGPARTIQDVVMDQFDYLLSIGQLTPELHTFMKGQFELLNDPNFSGENPPVGFQLGQAVFWNSIRKIKAAEMAKEQTDPLLIIQGQRDYQVVSNFEIPIWKEQLANRNNVNYRLYPKLNHFFTEGEGTMSRPEEYFIPTNIPEYVINDIADWIQSNPK